MTASVLQERETSIGGSSASSIALAFSSSLTSGSSLHVGGASNNGASSLSCAGSRNGSYGTALDNINDTNGNAQQRAAHWKFDNSAAGSETVTVTPNSSNAFLAICIREIGGTSGYDSAHNASNQTAPGTGTDALTSGNMTPSVQPGCVSAFSFDDWSGSGSPTAGTGFTAGLVGWAFGGGSTSLRAEFKRYTSTSALAATFTAINGTEGHITMAALFKEASSGAMTGSSALVFGETGTLAGAGAASATSALTMGQTGALKGAGALAASSALQFGQIGALAATGALAGTSALLLGQAGALAGTGVLAGTSALLIGQTGSLAAPGALTGTSALSFGASGTADLPSGAMAGTASLTINASATLSAFGALIGNCQIIFNASAAVPGIQTLPSEVPAGRRIRNIYRVTIDGQVFEFGTLQQALDLLEQAKALAEKVAEDDAIWKTPRKPPVITVSSRELRKPAAQAKREIQATYDRAAVHAELRMLFELSRRQEEDDTLLLLM